LWQCVLDVILKKELQTPSQKNYSTNSRILTHVEQNAVRYTAGFVMKKLMDKKNLDLASKECLQELIKSRADVSDDSDDDSSKQWLRASDRGGLYHITDLCLELFIELEDFTYPHLVHNDFEDMEMLHKATCENRNILKVWGECSMSIEDNEHQMSLLYDIVREWTKLRGHSIANITMEKFKKGKTKKKGLRKELKRNYKC
jgi:hypothetical protein